MLFENVIRSSTARSIRLSELRRNCRDSDSSQEYLDLFKETMNDLPGCTLLKQPLFEWNGFTSACWKFELHRATHQVCDHLLQESNDAFENGAHGVVTEKLKRAAKLMKSIISDLGWAHVPDVKSLREIQPEFLVAKILYIQSLFCENAYKECNQVKFTKIGYNCMELSNKIWSSGADFDLERQFLTSYYYNVAKTTDDYQEKVSYAVAARDLSSDKNIADDCAVWIAENDQAHFQEIVPITPPLQSDLPSVLSRLLSIV